MTQVTIAKSCIFCKEEHEIDVKVNDLARVEAGEHIQDVMTYLSADDRELLISGMCGKCFDEMEVPFE